MLGLEGLFFRRCRSDFLFARLRPSWLAWLAPCNLIGDELDRLEDLGVAGAAAQIASQGVLDFAATGVWIVAEQRLRRQNHARLAEATLQSAAAIKSILDRVDALPSGLLMQRAQALDGGDVFPFERRRQSQASEGWSAINQHRARTTISLVAALLAAGQSKAVAQDFEQTPVLWSSYIKRVAVDL